MSSNGPGLTLLVGISSTHVAAARFAKAAALSSLKFDHSQSAHGRS